MRAVQAGRRDGPRRPVGGRHDGGERAAVHEADHLGEGGERVKVDKSEDEQALGQGKASGGERRQLACGGRFGCCLVRVLFVKRNGIKI